MDIQPEAPSSRIRHRSVIAAGFLIVAWFYAWTNGPTAASWRIGGPQSDYYNVLMHGFLKGHLYMDAPVAEELKACPNPWDPAVRGPTCPIVQDATYYNGRYYLYYGAAPLVTLMLPFRLITGADMPLSLAAVCFAAGGLLVSLMLWESIRARYFPGVRPWVGLCAALLLGVANPLPVLLRRTLVYELPIAGGFFFSMLALLLLFRCVHSRQSRIAWLAAASVAMGLAVASRLTFLFAIPILLVPVWTVWRGQDRRRFSNLPWRELTAAIVPIAAIGALMALYNYLRFGQLAEFGTKYQVAETFNLMTPRRFAVDYVPFNVVDYFLATPDLSRHFPYFYFPGAWHWPIHAPPGYWGPELVPGLLVCFPICWLAALSIFAGAPCSGPSRGVWRAWQLCPWGLFIAITLCLLCYYAGAVRYMVDFTPSLMLCASIGLLVFEGWLIRKRTVMAKVIGRISWLVLLTASSIVAVMFSLGVRATFREVDPVGHARVARFFERLSFWNPQLPNHPGPVEITLQLDKLGTGQSEPLLACGAGRTSEHVFLRRSDGEHVILGYRQGLDGAAQLSRPIAVRAGAVHRLYLDLGSLYFGSRDLAATDGNFALQTAQKRWGILFDDEVVLQGRYNENTASPAGDLVFLGCDPNSDDFGKILLTPLLSVQRVPVSQAIERAAMRASASMDFKPPRDEAQGSQTLLAVAGSGADLRVEINYLSEGQVTLGFWSGGRQVAQSDRFPNNGQWHRLDLDQLVDGHENAIHVRMDGAVVTSIPGGRIDLRHDEFRPGWGARSNAAFTGLIRNAGSDSAQPLRRATRGDRTTISVIFPQQQKGTSDPLLVTGRTGAGDLYEVAYLGQDQVCFRQDHWGAGFVRTSRPITVHPGVAHRIVFDFVPSNSSVPPAGGAKRGTMRMTFDGQPVWDRDAACNPFKQDEVYVGFNAIGGSTCSREFSGEIVSCDTSPDSASLKRK